MIPSCPLCDSERADFYQEERGHRYFRCVRCRLVFLFPPPSSLELERFYQEECGSTFHHGAEIRESYEKRLEARYRLRIAGPALRSAPSRTVLEIGCGAGYLLDLLRRSGWTVAGTELAGDYVQFARTTLKLDVAGDFPPDRRFGAVVMFNVLSHLSDPECEFERYRQALLPGGVIALETGNVAELEPGRAGPLGAPEHLWHFSETALRALLGRHGFHDIRVHRLNVEWQRRALRHLGRRAGRKILLGTPIIAPAEPRPCSARTLLKKLATHVLLGLRFSLGRVLADPRHNCTLLVTARR